MKFKKKTIAFMALPILGFIIFLVIQLIAGTAKKDFKECNIILITLDTLRADYVSAYHQGKAETPNMDKIAAEGVLFERCIAQVPLTLPSHASILSGTYPTFHQIQDNGNLLVPDSLKLISEIARENGYATAAFVASYVLHSRWGINQGFDLFSDEFKMDSKMKASLEHIEKRADEVLADAKRYLKENKSSKMFTWIHLFDPHSPYNAPSPFKENAMDDPYRGEVEYMDAQLGEFFKFLKDEGLYDKTIIILASDHGEGLGDHQETYHGYFIYESTVHVPLIIRAPVPFNKKRIKRLVELVDVAPTIADFMGISSFSSFQGESLNHFFIEGDQYKKDYAYTESFYPRLYLGFSELRSVYSQENWKFISAPSEELYNLGDDPAEEKNLATSKNNMLGKLKQSYYTFINGVGSKSIDKVVSAEMNAHDQKRLSSLGYLGSPIPSVNNGKLLDPKEKVEVFNKLIQAKEKINQQEYNQVITLLEPVVEQNPQIQYLVLTLAEAYYKQMNFSKALRLYDEIQKHNPEYNPQVIQGIRTDCMQKIIDGLLAKNQIDRAINRLQGFLQGFPDNIPLLNKLGLVFFIKKDYPKATAVFKQSLKLKDPNGFAPKMLGRIFIVRKDLAQAEKYLNQAAAIDETEIDLNFYLALVAESRGKKSEAIQYYQKELKYHSGNFKAAYNLAIVFKNQGDRDRAIEYFKQVINANPAHNISYFMIAMLYFDAKINMSEAVDLCLKGISISPANSYTAGGYFLLADIHSYLGNRDKAENYYHKGNQLKETLGKQKR